MLTPRQSFNRTNWTPLMLMVLVLVVRYSNGTVLADASWQHIVTDFVFAIGFGWSMGRWADTV